MTKDEALQMCLEYIETNAHERRHVRWAVKDALAQPEQEPVLWMMPDGNTADKWALQFYGGQKGKPLYTTPPPRPWVGLTEAERIDTIDEEITAQGIEHFALAQAIEIKLKKKNT